MIKKHEKSTVVVNVSSEKLNEFFKECVSTIRCLKGLYGSITEFEGGSLGDDELYDILDDLYLKTSNIILVSDCFTSVIDAHNKYLRNTAYVLEKFTGNVRAIVDSGVYPNGQEVKILKEEVYSVVGGLSYFLVFDFAIKGLLDDLKSGIKSFSIDEVFAGYVKAHSLNAVQLAMELYKCYEDFKFRLDVFEEYPEYEGDFERVMGPDYNLIPEGVLDIGMVREVISGSVTPAELLQMLNCDDEEG